MNSLAVRAKRFNFLCRPSDFETSDGFGPRSLPNHRDVWLALARQPEEIREHFVGFFAFGDLRSARYLKSKCRGSEDSEFFRGGNIRAKIALAKPDRRNLPTAISDKA